MSETRDKRRKSDLDLFVLALIRSGVSTPYALKKEAGLSPGATIPAIKRLFEAEQIRQGKPSVRGRTEYRVTAAGKKQLKSGWQVLIDHGPSGDLDADLRVALLAISEGKAYLPATQMLRGSAARMLEMSETVTRESDTDTALSLAVVYRELRSTSVKALLDAQAAAATRIADNLPRRLPGTLNKMSSSTPKKPSGRRVKRLK